MSNPMFEASVRLQLDLGNFEQQAQQSIKRVLDGYEAATQQALRNMQQRVAQVNTQFQQQQQQLARVPVGASVEPQVADLTLKPKLDTEGLRALESTSNLFEVVFGVKDIPQEELVQAAEKASAQAPPVVLPVTPEVSQQETEAAITTVQQAADENPITITPVVAPLDTTQAHQQVEAAAAQLPPLRVPVDLANFQAEATAAGNRLEELQRSSEEARRELESVSESLAAIPPPPPQPIAVKPEIDEAALEEIVQNWEGKVAELQQRLSTLKIPDPEPPTARNLEKELAALSEFQARSGRDVPRDERGFSDEMTKLEQKFKDAAAAGQTLFENFPANFQQISDAERQAADATEQLTTAMQELERAKKNVAAVEEATAPVIPVDEFAEERVALAQRKKDLEEQISTEREFAAAARERLSAIREEVSRVRPVDTGVPPDLAQAFEQAQALASQPVDFTIESNADQFKQETAAAFDATLQLAKRNATALAQIADEAAEKAAEAAEKAASTVGDKTAANTEAQLARTFANQAEANRRAADEIIADIEGAAIDAQQRPAQELNLLADTAAAQARTAGILGDEATRAAKELEAAQLAGLGAAEGFELQAANLSAQAAQAEGAVGANLEAKTAEMIAAAEATRVETAKLQQEAVSPPGGGGGGDDPNDPTRLRDAFSSIARGRSGGLGGLIGGAARFGLAGFAATAAFQAFGELQGMLRATGDEAFTTQGKIRNLGAELIGGNLIGGVKALLATKPATFIGGLAEEMKALKDSTDETFISLEEVINLQIAGSVGTKPEQTPFDAGPRRGPPGVQVEIEGATDALEEFLRLQRESGAINEEQQKSLAAVAQEQAEIYKAAGSALQEFVREREAAFAAGEREQLLPSGTPGAASQRTGIPAGVDFRTPQQATAAGQAILGAQNQIREALIAREENDVERAQLELDNAVIIKQQADTAALNALNTGQLGAALVAQVQAQTGVVTAQRALKEAAEAAEREGREAGNSVRASVTSRIQDDRERLAAELDNARIIQSQARAAFEVAKAAKLAGGSAEEARVAYEGLVAATTGVADAAAAVAAEAEQARERAQTAGNAIRNARIANITDPDAQQAATVRARQIEEGQARRAFERAKAQGKSQIEIDEAYAEWQLAIEATISAQNAVRETAKQATEDQEKATADAVAQSLENDIARAALTKRKSDDKKFFDIAIGYYRDLARNADNAQEREEAQAKIIDLRRRRREALTGEAQSAGEDLELLRIQNRISAAGLTDTISDDKRFTRQLIAYWKEKVEALKGEAVEQERARAQLIAAQRALKSLQQTSSQSSEVFARELMELAADTFRQFGSNISASPNGLLAPQDAIGFFSGSLIGAGGNVDRLGEAQLSESQKQTAILIQIDSKLGGSTNPRKAPIAPEESRVATNLDVNATRGM